MKCEVIGTPADREAVRLDFDEFLTELESTPSRKVIVMFGFAWGNYLFEKDWPELELSGSELRERVAAAEESELGSIGSDDLYITLPELNVQRQYCHEADIHISASSLQDSYLVAEVNKWKSLGWKVYFK